MKNKILKISITLSFLLCNFIVFSQPGDDNENGDLEGDDPIAAPINGKLLLLAIAGIVFAYITFKNHKKNNSHTNVIE